MEKNQLQELLGEVKSQVEATLKEGGIDKKAFDQLSEKIAEVEKKESVDVAEYNAWKAEYVTLASEFKALKEKGMTNKESKKSLVDILDEKKDEIANLRNKKGESLRFELKDAGTITTANVIPTVEDGLSMLLTQFEAGLTRVPRSAPFLTQYLPTAPTTGKVVAYAEMKNPDGGANNTAEGQAKSQADFEIVEASVNVEKITAYIKTSKEALADIPALAGEINNELISLVEIKADSDVLLGDGSGNSIKGIIESSTTFAAGDFAGAIDTPNEYDVIQVAISQIETAEVQTGQPAGFVPNLIVMNPVDVKKMKLTKDGEKGYVFPSIGIDGTSIDNIPVVSNARMVKGDFLVMDTTKANYRIREGVTIDIGYENDDFTKNLVTILGEKRHAFYIKSNHEKAFVSGTFSTAKAALAIEA
jgi:HK97 family phage major capsid protein